MVPTTTAELSLLRPCLTMLHEIKSQRGRFGVALYPSLSPFPVGSIHAAFDPELRTDQPWALKSECGMASTCSRRTFHFHEKSFADQPVDLVRGQEFGHFEV